MKITEKQAKEVAKKLNVDLRKIKIKNLFTKRYKFLFQYC